MDAAERQRRYAARKRGEDVPKVKAGPKPGYKQSPDHIAKRVRWGADNHRWQGDEVSIRGGRARAERLYRDIGACGNCGNGRAERHHINGNTADNRPTNIALFCRPCHMAEDGRLDAVREQPGRGSHTR